MRESLAKLKAALEQEKRLNASIKQKKVGSDKLLFNHYDNLANVEFRVPYSQRYLVLGLVRLVGLGLPLLLWLRLVGLVLCIVSGIALNKYRCEYDTLTSMFADNLLFTRLRV